MTALLLLIPDAPLCEAVLEQVKAVGLPMPIIVSDMVSLAKAALGEKEAVILIDIAALDKKSLPQIEALADYDILLLGGDGNGDFIAEHFAKPLRLGHLITRLRYYLETAPLLRDKPLLFGPWRLEPKNRRLVRDGTEGVVRLTEKETALLVYLAGCSAPATRQSLLAEIWGYGESIDTHTLETHIYQLRRKIDRDDENWLVNDAGAYRLAGIVT